MVRLSPENKEFGKRLQVWRDTQTLRPKYVAMALNIAHKPYMHLEHCYVGGLRSMLIKLRNLFNISDEDL